MELLFGEIVGFFSFDLGKCLRGINGVVVFVLRIFIDCFSFLFLEFRCFAVDILFFGL